MIISSDLRMEQHRGDDHQEDALHFITTALKVRDFRLGSNWWNMIFGLLWSFQAILKIFANKNAFLGLK